MSTTRRESPPKFSLLCYVTDRRQFPGSPADQEARLLDKIGECAAAGVDYVQLREKDLNSRDLLELARKAVAALSAGSLTRLLINSRTDVALASGAHGVQLPAGDLPASEVRAIWNRAGKPAAIIGVSAHSIAEVALAEAHGADFALLGPVFEKDGLINPPGPELLRQACSRPSLAAGPMPVLALGGVTLENASRCWAAGASGIAGIRLFQQNDVERIVNRMRTMSAG